MSEEWFSAPGKLIVSGEHSVVYGQPALAIPLPLGLRAKFISKPIKKPYQLHIQHIFSVCANYFGKSLPTKQVIIKSDLLPSSGLGSSAALALALIKAYANWQSIDLTAKDELVELVQRSEQYAHGTPSGIDATTIVYDQPIVLTLTNGSLDFTLHSKDFFPINQCLLINSGQATESTKEMVELVGKHPQREELVGKIGQVTNKLLKSLANGQPDWQLLTENERLLEKLGVVGSKAQKIIGKIEQLGGQAKISGAGGRKTGSGVILAHHSDPTQLTRLADDNHWSIIKQV